MTDTASTFDHNQAVDGGGWLLLLGIQPWPRFFQRVILSGNSATRAAG